MRKIVLFSAEARPLGLSDFPKYARCLGLEVGNSVHNFPHRDGVRYVFSNNKNIGGWKYLVPYKDSTRS